MNTATRRLPTTSEDGSRRPEFPLIKTHPEPPLPANARRACDSHSPEPLARVFILAENRLIREALSKMLTRRGNLQVVGLNSEGDLHPQGLPEEASGILLLTSRGSLAEDVLLLRRIRSDVPQVKILLLGVTDDETDFFQYVRAGIAGYLPRDASTDDVLKAVEAVHQGEAVCSGSLCARLFHFFEREATSLPSSSAREKLGLTRREQQIIPLIAQGLTNKEIANHFNLSEQTIKNHLYRMKHKIGAGDRLGIVHLYRAQGFLV